MLKGTDEELDYHSRRAATEYSLYEESGDLVVASAHLGLAHLHSSRHQLSSALRDLRTKGPSKVISRTDKEG
jgi:hypothetical protein